MMDTTDMIMLSIGITLFGMIFLAAYLDFKSNKKATEAAEEYFEKEKSKPKYYLKVTLFDGSILQTRGYEPEMKRFGSYYIFSSEEKARQEANYIINNGCNMNNVFYPGSEIRKVEVLS